MKQPKMTEGSVNSSLVKLAIPMMLGIISVFLFNVIDTFYIGQLGAKELAAASFTFPIVFIVMSIAMGIGVGGASVISRAIGEGNHRKVQRLTTDSLFLALVIVLSVVLIGINTIEPVFSLMGASSELIPLIHDYMFIWYLGMGLVIIPIVGNSAIRATGDTKTPMLIMMVAAGVNTVLDPFLIFGLGPFPRLELRGAAIATALSYLIVFSVSLWVLGKREKMLSIEVPNLKMVIQSWKPILFIGIPVAATNMLNPLSNAIFTRMIANHGTEPVAAFGVGTRLESLSLIGIMGLSSVLTPYIGQNWGAQKYDRVKQALRFSLQFTMIWGAVAFLFLSILSNPLGGLFTDDVIILETIVNFLWVVPISYGFFGMILIVNATYNALNKPYHSSTLILLRLFIFSIPLAYLGSQFWQTQGVFIGISLGNIIVGSISFFSIKQYLKKNILPKR